jgi:hypothetical protein
LKADYSATPCNTKEPEEQLRKSSVRVNLLKSMREVTPLNFTKEHAVIRKRINSIFLPILEKDA